MKKLSRVPAHRASPEKVTGFFSRNKYLIFAFLAPFAIMYTIFLFAGASPFGSRQILVTDLWHQYYPFLVDFQDKLQSGSSLLYTWSIGMGMNFTALSSYYLASPVNFLVLFVPKAFLRDFLVLAVAAKIGFAGFSFAFFLKKVYGRNDWSIVFFAGLFASCAFFMGYYWNIIWLDTAAALPLVVTGFVALQKEGKYKLYILSLAFSLLTNYYIGIFTCIFILLCFFCYNICCCGSAKSFGKNFWRIAWTTVTALCITAVLILPTLMALQNTYSAVNKFPTAYAINIGSTNDLNGTLEAVRKVLSNTLDFTRPTAKQGLPNVACGMVPLFLAFLFLFSRRVRLKEKIVNVSLLIIFVFSFIIRQLDYIWHGFHFTNMIPYRFSFLFSFVLVAMAYRAFMLLDGFSVFDVLLAGLLSSAIIILAVGIQELVPIVVSLIIMLLLFSVLLMYISGRVNRSFINAFIFILAAAEIVSSMANGVRTVSSTSKDDYPRGAEDTQKVISEMNDIEAMSTDLWRSEFTTTQTLNDGALNGTRGVSAFSSMLNVNITKFAEDFGVAGWQSGNRYCYYESSPVTNLFLNLKYIIDRDNIHGNTDYTKLVYKSGDVSLYKNTAYLPLGFVTKGELAGYEVGLSPNNPIDAQNRFFRLATGVDRDVYETLDVVSQKHTDPEQFSVSKQGRGVYSFSCTDSEVSPHLKFNYTMPKDGMICFYSSVSGADRMKVMRNDEEVENVYIKRGYLGCCGEFKKGDKISFYIDLDKNAKGSAYMHCAYFNSEVFNEGYNALSHSLMKASKVDDTVIEGTIDVKQDGLFYTSVPYEDGWSAYVDGEETEITPVGNAMLAFPVSEGEHSIRLEYMPKGLKPGVIVSLAAVLLLILLSVYEKLRKRQLMPPLSDSVEWFSFERSVAESEKMKKTSVDDDMREMFGVLPPDDGLIYRNEDEELKELLTNYEEAIETDDSDSGDSDGIYGETDE